MLGSAGRANTQLPQRCSSLSLSLSLSLPWVLTATPVPPLERGSPAERGAAEPAGARGRAGAARAGAGGIPRAPSGAGGNRAGGEQMPHWILRAPIEIPVGF
jgi:hypothetical protein